MGTRIRTRMRPARRRSSAAGNEPYSGVSALIGNPTGPRAEDREDDEAEERRGE